MAIEVYLVFDDRSREKVREFDDLQEAFRGALEIAEVHSKDLGDGHGPPVKVDVYRDGRMEISVSVIRGGLSVNKLASKSRSM